MPGGKKWEGGKVNAETFTLLLQAVLTFSEAACPCLPLPFSQICIPNSAGLPNLSIKSTLLAPASHSHAVKVKSMISQSEAEASLPLHPQHSCSTDLWVWRVTGAPVVSQHHGRCIGVAWTHVETSCCTRKKGFWPITWTTSVPWLQHSHINKASLVCQHPATSQSTPCHHLYCIFSLQHFSDKQISCLPSNLFP